MSNVRRVSRATGTIAALLAAILLLGVVAYAAPIAKVQTQVRRAMIPGVAEKAIQLPEARLAQVKAGKQTANLNMLRQNYFVRNNVPFIRGAEGEEYALIPLDKMEFNPTAVQVQTTQKLLGPVAKFEPYILKHPGLLVEVKTGVDHRPNQTPVKNQSGRGTCVCFASMAGLEAKYGGGSLDLSENYANYLYMKAESRGCKSAGLQTHMSADYLSANGVCFESVCPYQTSFPSWCNNGGNPAPAKRTDAAAKDPYKIKSYQKIWRKDDLATDTGLWINNPRYLEALLDAGYDIVYGTHVAGWSYPYTGVIDVTLGGDGNPLPSVGGHAMLIVGYDRPGEYFIVKNSWGTNKGQAGYLYLSYDYIRTYAKYGYIITDVEPLLVRMIRPRLRAIPMPSK